MFLKLVTGDFVAFLTQEYQTCEFNKLGVTKFCPYEVLERINDNSHMLKLPSRGVNVRPNLRTRHEPNTGFFGVGLGLNGFGS